jgi:hypothetical protein
MVEPSLDALRGAQEQALARLGQAWRLFSEALSGAQAPGAWDPGSCRAARAGSADHLRSALE